MPDYINGQLIGVGVGEFPFDVLAVVRDTLPEVKTFPLNSAALRLSDHTFHEILMRTIAAVPATDAVFTDAQNTSYSPFLRWRNIHTHDLPLAFSLDNDVIYNTTLLRFRRLVNGNWTTVRFRDVADNSLNRWMGVNGLENSESVLNMTTALAYLEMFLRDAVIDGTQDPTRLYYRDQEAGSPTDGGIGTSEWDYANSDNLKVGLLTSAIMPSYQGFTSI